MSTRRWERTALGIGRNETATRYIGLDIGTTSIGVAVVDVGTGQVVFTGSREHGADMAGAGDEHLQDPERLLQQGLTVLEESAVRHGPVAGIGVTGQMHGILYLDERGHAVSPLFTWLDARAGRVGPGGQSYLAELEHRVGRPVPPGFGAATHFVNLCTGAVPSRARWLCGIPEYVAMGLVGASDPVTDPTLAHGLGLYDVAGQDFDRDSWSRLGAPRVALPRVVPGGRMPGAYRGRIPVAVPLGDNQASFLGSVREPERSALVNIGTGAQISCLDRLAGAAGDGPLLGPPLEPRPYPGGRVLYVGASLAGGKAMELLASLAADILRLADPARDWHDTAFALLERVPDRIPDPPLKVDTRFAGARAAPGTRGSIGGITLGNLTWGHLVHGLAQGIVDELYTLWSGAGADRRTEQSLTHVVGSGNALRRSRVLRARLAATFQRPVYVPEHREEAAVGAALYAASQIEGRPADELARALVRYRG